MLYTMRKATLLISILAFGAFGMLADDHSDYQAMMKAAAGANGAANGAVAGGDVAAVAAKAKDAAAAFDQMTAFWKAKGKDDAVKFSMSASEALKAAASATSIDDQKAALAKVRPTCGGCHMVYRDGSKFKGM